MPNVQEINLFIRMPDKAADAKPSDSPGKILQEACKITRTLGEKFGEDPLPSSMTKEMHVRNLAQDHISDVEFVIERAKYQNELYRRLEEADKQKRQSIEEKMGEKEKRYDETLKKQKEKEQGEVKLQMKHKGEVYKKHVDQERLIKQQKNEEAMKLRKSLLQFYAKEKSRKKQSDKRQLNVSTCYQDAVSRLDKIHEKNEEYSVKTERNHLMRMKRNSGKDQNLLTRSRMKSAENRKKESVYWNNSQLLNQKEHHCIQVYCKDLDTSIKCFEGKKKLKDQERERIQKFLKERVEKWQELKKRVEADQASIPDRCISIMVTVQATQDKTSKAAFRQTASTFKDSSNNWHKIVQDNKMDLYEKAELERERILETHLDMRLRNTHSFRVSERLGSYRNKAHKVSLDCS